MNLTFRGGAALVTGGSGGIGSALAAALAESGVPVGITYASRREDAERIAAAGPGRAPMAAFAFRSGGAGEAALLIRDVEQRLGAVRYLVACAGVAQEAAFHTLEETDWNRILQTNLAGPVSVARGAVVSMMKHGFGRILFVSSASAVRGFPGHTIYAASKAGLCALARSLALECGPFGVTVNALAPGFIETPMTASLPDRLRADLVRRIPVGRFGLPAEAAAAACFLLSDQAGYVTGQTWVVDGGLTA